MLRCPSKRGMGQNRGFARIQGSSSKAENSTYWHLRESIILPQTNFLSILYHIKSGLLTWGFYCIILSAFLHWIIDLGLLFVLFLYEIINLGGSLYHFVSTFAWDYWPEVLLHCFVHIFTRDYWPGKFYCTILYPFLHGSADPHYFSAPTPSAAKFHFEAIFTRDYRPGRFYCIILYQLYKGILTWVFYSTISYAFFTRDYWPGGFHFTMLCQFLHGIIDLEVSMHHCVCIFYTRLLTWKILLHHCVWI